LAAMTAVEPRRRSLLPSAPTAKMRKALVEDLKKGVGPDVAANAARITWPVLQKWIDRGIRVLETHAEGADILDEEKPYAMLVIDVSAAMAAFDIEAVEAIKGHGKKRSQSWEWLLERTRQERYARPMRMTVGTADNRPLQINVEHMNSVPITAMREAKAALESLAQSDEIIEAEIVEED
jgi:hypothetical protein